MSSGLRYGFARAWWSTLGLILGIMLQIAIVGIGLGALLATSELGFAIVKWLGVAYLIYLGWKQIRTDAAPVDASGSQPRISASVRELVMRGFFINASNPKGTVFLLAVVPQFLDASRPLLSQYSAIAGTMAFTDLVAMSCYSLLATRVLSLLRSPRHIRWLNRTFGGLFILAGVVLAGFRRH
ncbi:LysE family transporter [Pseudomonas sp. S 311-6]|jgi:homoserine/homoserine lactone efflux protein|nr:LysE family transporter [Pseudomonas sp. S 311-6]